MLTTGKMKSEDWVKILIIDVPSITQEWIAYRVLMNNTGQRKWTTVMCGLIKQYNNPSYVTVHPKGTKGSLFKQEEGSYLTTGTIETLL